MPLDNKYLAKMRALNGGSGGTSTPTWDNILNKPDVVLSVNGSTPDAAGNVEVQGGGVTSWNDLTDKPFYEETSVVEVLPETTYVSDPDVNSGEMGGASVGLEVGKTYIVNWNGVEYTCVGVLFEANGVVLGNLGGIDSENAENTGEPFVMLDMPDYGAMQIVPLDGLTSVTVSISGWSTTIKTLDPKYIKDMYYEEEGGVTTILEETSVTCEGGNPGVLETVLPFEDGKTYTTVWNGVSFESPCVGVTDDGEEMYVIGNVAALGIGTTGADCPFVIASLPTEGGTAVFAFEGDGTYTISITGSDTTIHKIDNKYIDAEWMAKPIVTENAEIIAETTVSGKDVVIGSGADEAMKAAKYTVVFDGVEYQCAVYSAKLGDVYLFKYMGNGALADIALPNANGEPFLLFWYYDTSPDVDGLLFCNCADTESHTISIFGQAFDYPVLPEHYLPSSLSERRVVIESEGAAAVSAAEAALLEGKEAYYGSMDSRVLSAETSMNDPNYPAMVYMQSGADVTFGMHNMYILLPKGCLSDDRSAVVPVGTYQLFPRLDHNGKMAADNLPDTVVQNGDTELILTSSTEGSTKQFKITVDDSGTITATEVT